MAAVLQELATLTLVAVVFVSSLAFGQNQYDVRLVGGDSDLEGRVEVFVDGAWGTVCDDDWDLKDAKVACHQLGFFTAKSALTNAHFGRGSGPIVYDEVRCEGDERKLQFCPLSTSHNCNHDEDAGVVCAGMDPADMASVPVRLVGGDNDLEGRVEVFVDGVWGTVCDDDWDLKDAQVVCRQLGFFTAKSALTNAHFGRGSGPIVYDEVRCGGDESRLQFCPLSTSHNCNHGEDAGVVCAGMDPTQLAPSTIRLVDGSSALEGRVEVLVGAVWGTVCDDDWDLHDARVVCLQLGYSRALSAPGSAQFGRGTIPIVLDDVNCKGSEKQLQDCPAIRENNCNHGEDAGVICASASAGDIRLIGGSSALEGRVEVFVNGAWGTVCDDGWDLADASVACRQLGYYHALSALGSAHFGQGTGAIVLDGVECTGRESRLQDCASSSYHNCGHGEDAGIVCSGGLDTSAVRLAGDNSNMHGRVEVFINGVWGTVCDDDWDLNDARVVCRQLGFVDALSAVGSAEFGQGSGDIFLDNLACDGTERTLLDCPRAATPNCGHSEDAGVICLTATGQKAIRLVGGSSALEGRVEVYSGNLWGTICDDDWDLADATVVCRQLGYGEALSAPGDATFGEGTGLIAMDEVDCKGTEDNLSDCAYQAMEDCQHSEDAGVSCSGMQPAYEFGQVRLVDGSSEYEGYVEVYYNQQWGTVCNNEWDQVDADVVCEELGFDFAISTSESMDYGRYTYGPIWLSNVRCYGTEDRLANCYHRKWDNNYCSHSQDVWVKCNGTPSTSLSVAAIIGIAVGSFVGLILCIFCSYWCCCSSKNTTTASPAASRTTYSQVPANEANTATPVIHYHPAQQSVSVAPSMPAQPSAPTWPANEVPPPSYEMVVAQPTMFPQVPTKGYEAETTQQVGPYNPAYPPAQPPPACNHEPSNLGTDAPRAAPQAQALSNPTYELLSD